MLADRLFRGNGRAVRGGGLPLPSPSSRCGRIQRDLMLVSHTGDPRGSSHWLSRFTYTRDPPENPRLAALPATPTLQYIVVRVGARPIDTTVEKQEHVKSFIYKLKQLDLPLSPTSVGGQTRKGGATVPGI